MALVVLYADTLAAIFPRFSADEFKLCVKPVGYAAACRAKG